MKIPIAALKLLEAMLEIEVYAFTKDKISALFERQVALKKLKIDLVSFIKERPNSRFVISNTTATNESDMTISIKNCVSPTRIYEIKITCDCTSFEATIKPYAINETTSVLFSR